MQQFFFILVKSNRKNDERVSKRVIMEDAKYYPKFLYPDVVIGDNYKICYPDLPEKPKKPIKAVGNNGKGFFSTSVFLAIIISLISLEHVWSTNLAITSFWIK